MNTGTSWVLGAESSGAQRVPTAATDRPRHTRGEPQMLRTGWPLVAITVGYPVLWVLGVSAFAVQLAAVPMAVQLWRRGGVRVPRGFGLWVLFLVCSGLGILVLGVDPIGTVPDSFSGRLLAFAVRQSQYVATSVVLLYVGNLGEKELPVRRILWLFSVFFGYVVVGGVLGLLWPHGGFPSLLELVLPRAFTSVPYVSHLVHPTFAQVQEFGDASLPRPAAPFAYTNIWGSTIALLGIWFVLHGASSRSRRVQLCTAVGAAIGLVTVIYSLNRGVWLGIVLCVLYAAGAFLRRGRIAPLVLVASVTMVALVVIVASPLRQVIDNRAENGKSDSIRAFTTERALDLATASPLVGFGGTRSAVGSASSIAVGKSPECTNCGNVPIGINGYLWTLLVTTGFGGTLLFFSFWISQLWHSRGDRTAVASAARLTLVVSILFSFFYTLDPLVPFVALGLLWRGQTAREREDHRVTAL